MFPSAVSVARAIRGHRLKVRQLPDLRIVGDKFVDMAVDSEADSALAGRGADKNPDIALIKALAEITEREAFQLQAAQDPAVKNTNGFAAHGSRELAILAGLAELCERDAFCVHFFIQRPFLHIRDVEIEGGLVQVFAMESEYGFARIALGSNSRGMWELGAGFSFHSTEQAELAAILEAARGRHALEPLTVSEFESLNLVTPTEHRRLLYDRSYREQFASDYLLSSSGSSFDPTRPPSLSKVDELRQSLHVTDLESPMARSLGLVCVRVVSPLLQDLWFGPASDRQIHPKTKKLANEIFSKEGTYGPPYPHPFG